MAQSTSASSNVTTAMLMAMTAVTIVSWLAAATALFKRVSKSAMTVTTARPMPVKYVFGGRMR